jgi:hypothetical protein
MMGRTHAASGLAAGAVLLPLVWIATRKARWGIPLCDTNSWLERIVTVACIVGTVWALADQSGHNPVPAIAQHIGG